MAKRHDLVHYVKDDRVFKHSVVVELAHILHLSDSTLVELEVVLLEPETD